MKALLLALAFSTSLLLQPAPATCRGLCPMAGASCLHSGNCGYGDCACALPSSGGLGVCVATD